MPKTTNHPLDDFERLHDRHVEETRDKLTADTDRFRGAGQPRPATKPEEKPGRG